MEGDHFGPAKTESKRQSRSTNSCPRRLHYYRPEIKFQAGFLMPFKRWRFVKQKNTARHTFLAEF